MKDESHENIDSEVDEKDIYEIDKIILDEKEWRKRAFESKLENINDIKRQNGMTCIHKNKVNKIAEYNLLHDILNPSKHNIFLDSH